MLVKQSVWYVGIVKKHWLVRRIINNGVSWVDEVLEILFENRFPQLYLSPQLYIGAYYETYVKLFTCKNCSVFLFPSNSSMIDNQILFEQDV